MRVRSRRRQGGEFKTLERLLTSKMTFKEKDEVHVRLRRRRASKGI